MSKPLPLQPIYLDEHGVLRFRENKLVRYLLDNGGIDMNALAVASAIHHFSQEDQEQFAQLIGYSLSGFGELSYVNNKTYGRVVRAAKRGAAAPTSSPDKEQKEDK